MDLLLPPLLFTLLIEPLIEVLVARLEDSAMPLARLNKAGQGGGEGEHQNMIAATTGITNRHHQQASPVLLPSAASSSPLSCHNNSARPSNASMCNGFESNALRYNASAPSASWVPSGALAGGWAVWGEEGGVRVLVPCSWPTRTTNRNVCTFEDSQGTQHLGFVGCGDDGAFIRGQCFGWVQSSKF